MASGREIFFTVYALIVPRLLTKRGLRFIIVVRKEAVFIQLSTFLQHPQFLRIILPNRSRSPSSSCVWKLIDQRSKTCSLAQQCKVVDYCQIKR